MAAVLTPDVGSPINPSDPVVFDLTDASETLTSILITVRHDTGVIELAHDGTNFTSFYASGSTRTAITNGYRYSIVRAGGWADVHVVISAFPFAGTGVGAINFSSDFGVLSDPPGEDVALSVTGATAGSFGDAQHVATFTVDSKGRLTASGQVAAVLLDNSSQPIAHVGSGGATSTNAANIGDVNSAVAVEAATRAAFDAAHPGTISALTGDVTASGSGSVAATLANLPQSVLVARTGALTADLPVNGHKITGLGSGGATGTNAANISDATSIAAAAVAANNTGHAAESVLASIAGTVADLPLGASTVAGRGAVGDVAAVPFSTVVTGGGGVTSLTGDVTGAGPGATATTLANLPQAALLARTGALTADLPVNGHKITGLGSGIGTGTNAANISDATTIAAAAAVPATAGAVATTGHSVESVLVSVAGTVSDQVLTPNTVAGRAGADVTAVPFSTVVTGGGGVTSLTGDVTGTGPGAAATTLANLPQSVLVARTGALTADMPVNGHKITGLGSGGTTPTNAANIADTIAAAGLTVANETALAALDASNLGTGTRVWVQTYKCFFVLDKVTTRTAIPNVVRGASGGVGWWWARQSLADPFWGTMGFVTVNPATGDDELGVFAASQAAADASPFKSFAEINRRFPEEGFSIDVFCHVTDSIPDGDEDSMILTRLRMRSYDTKFVISCDAISTARPVVYAGTVASYTIPVFASDTNRHLTLTGVSGTIVGKKIQKSDGSKSAFVLKDMGSGVYRISRPRTTNTITGDFGSTTEFANGDSVQVVDLPTMPINPFPATVFSRDITNSTSNIILTNTKLRSSSSEALDFDNGGASTRLIDCIVVDATIFGGINATWANVLLTSNAIGLNFMGGVRNLTVRGLSFLNTQLLMVDTALEIDDSFDVEGNSGQAGFATLHMQRGVCSVTFTSTDIGLFNSANGLAHSDVATGNLVEANVNFYGAGNSNALLSLAPGCKWLLVTTGQFATTSAAHPISINGVGYDYTDLPISLIASQTLVNSV